MVFNARRLGLLYEQYLATNHAGWRVVNASISGETTGGALARLPGVLDATTPKIVIVELGGNDGLRGYPISKMQDNLLRIIEKSQAQGAATLLAEMQQIPPNYGRRYTEEFTASFSAVAAQSNTVLIPVFTEQIALQPEFMQDDGIHPTAVAQPLIVDAVLPHLLLPLVMQTETGIVQSSEALSFFWVTPMCASPRAAANRTCR